MSGRFVRNSILSTLAGLGTALGGFLSMVVVARLLAPAETGRIAYTLWFVTLAMTAADLGLTQSLARYPPEMAARGEDRAAAALAALLLRTCLALALCGGLLLAGLGHLAGRAPGPVAWLAGLLFTLQFASAGSLAALRGFQRFDTAARLTLASLALQVAAVGLGASLYGMPGVLAGYCAGSLLPIGIALRLAAGPAGLERALGRRLVRFALYSWAGALVLSLVWSRAEIFFLQRSWGAEAVAMFTVGFTFSNLAAQGPLLLTGGLLAFFAETRGRADAARMHEAYAAATRLLAFLLFPTCFGLAAILPVLLPLVYGPAFAGAVPVAVVLVIGAAVGASGAPGSQLIYAHERSDFIFASGLLGAAATVAAGLLVVPAYGMMGAALCRGAIHVLMLALGFRFVDRRLGCPPPLGALARLLAAALLCAMAAHGCIRAVAEPRLALPLAVAIGALAYAGAVRALGALPEADVARLRRLTDRIPLRGARAPMGGLLSLLAPRGA